jgi:endonuclease YncB( thermonuclease family)
VTFLERTALAFPHPGRVALAAAAIFAAGLTLGALLGSNSAGRSVATPLSPVNSSRSALLRVVYPAEVVRVLDGDTFEARVKVWPGMEAVTRVRLRSVDAPEMKARCEDERVKALAAKDALMRMLGEGSVGLTNVSQDKYGGRVDAEASTASTRDIGDALIALGLARRYDGGRRQSWCG